MPIKIKQIHKLWYILRMECCVTENEQIIPTPNYREESTETKTLRPKNLHVILYIHFYKILKQAKLTYTVEG